MSRKKQTAPKQMTCEQVADLARELMFGHASGTIEESLGETMLNACYDRRVGGVIRHMNYRKGESAKMDALIDATLKRIG